MIQHHPILIFQPILLQGDVDEARREKDCKCVFMTVHDIGNNHRSMVVSQPLYQL